MFYHTPIRDNTVLKRKINKRAINKAGGWNNKKTRYDEQGQRVMHRADG